MFIYLDITNLDPRRNRYLNVFLSRNSDVSRKVFLRFENDALSSRKALRVLAHVYPDNAQPLELSDEHSFKLLYPRDFHPDIRQLTMKRKLSKSEQRKLRKLKSGVSPDILKMMHRRRRFAKPQTHIRPNLTPSNLAAERTLFRDSIWPPEPKREHFFGDWRFAGNCSPTVCMQVLQRYTRKGEVLLDPMCGSGTMLDVANAMKRECIAFDLNPIPERNDIAHADARSLPLPDESMNFVFLHPPYWDIHVYSNPPAQGDLSTMTYEDFLLACKDVLAEAWRVIRPSKFVVVLIGAVRKKLKYYDIPSELFPIARDLGLELYDKAVRPIHGERSAGLRVKMLARLHNFHLIKSETLLIFRKSKSI
jgi:hypothetical protein